jgi:hypothetical protein
MGGWYLRKAFPLGRFLRLNLSKRGVGLSGGVPGLRVGVDAGGTPYVSGGRGGIYFRERLGFGRGRPRSGPEGLEALPPEAAGPARVWLRWLKRAVWTVLLFFAGLMVLSVVGLQLGWW